MSLLRLSPISLSGGLAGGDGPGTALVCAQGGGAVSDQYVNDPTRCDKALVASSEMADGKRLAALGILNARLRTILAVRMMERPSSKV